MCEVCISTGRMTIAEWDQIQAAEREQDLGTLLQLSEDILAREDARRAARPGDEERDAEDVKEDASLDHVVASLVELAKDYDDLPLKQAHTQMATVMAAEAEKMELAYGLAALVTRIRRNS